MNKVMIVAVALAGLGGLGACSKKDKFDEVLAEMGSFKDKMCACTDKACADKVQDDWHDYRKTMKDKLGKDTKPSESQDKTGRELDAAMRTCRHKFDAPEGATGTGGNGGNGGNATTGGTGGNGGNGGSAGQPGQPGQPGTGTGQAGQPGQPGTP